MTRLSKPFTVAIISGSVAASNAQGLVSVLGERRGEPVVAVLTRAATRFVTLDAIRYAGGAAATITDDSCPLTDQPDHIWLATHMSGLLVYPASADFIGRTAWGLTSDTASLTFLASHRKPRMLTPSMNALMWSNPVVQEAVARHRANGTDVVPTPDGLAPGVPHVVEAFNALIERRVSAGLSAKSASSA
jgi:phosphopantothenoylcysteine synthetase/decarboxylase